MCLNLTWSWVYEFPHYYMFPLCAVSKEHAPPILVSMSSRSSVYLLKRLHLWRRDEMRWATVSREMKISASLVGGEVAHFKTLHFSLRLLTLLPLWSSSNLGKKKDQKKNLCTHWSNIVVSRAYSAVFFSSAAFRGFNLKVMLLCCLKIAPEKIILHQHIQCRRTFSCNFHFHLHMTEVINLLHFDLCSLCLSACLIVCLKNPCSFCHCSLAVNEHWSGIAQELNKSSYSLKCVNRRMHIF